MKMMLRLLVSILFLTWLGMPLGKSSAPPMHRQDDEQSSDQEVKAVLDKYFEAIGGHEAVSIVTSMVEEGESRYSFPFESDSLTLRYLLIAKSPDKKFTRVVDPVSQSGLLIGLHGHIGWVNNFGPLEAYSLSDIHTPFDVSWHPIFSPAVLNPSLFDSMSIWGYRTFRGRNLVCLQGTEGGVKYTFDLDMESGLLVHMRQSWSDGRTDYADFDDYRYVGGIKVPFKRKNTTPEGTEDFEVTRIEWNIPVDDSIFELPKTDANLAALARMTGTNH